MKNSNHRERKTKNVFILTAGVTTSFFGLVILLGWILRLPLLNAFSANLIPMAPSTALLFFLLGLALSFRSLKPTNCFTYLFGLAVGSTVSLIALLLFFSSALGIYPSIEHLGISIAGTLSGVPIGHMSIVTAICFVLSALSFLLILFSSIEHPKRLVVAFMLASLVALVFSLFLFAYLLGTPLMYGGTIIPPSLPTSLAFLMLALGLSNDAGSHILHNSGMKNGTTSSPSYVLLLIFILLAAGILTGGYFWCVRLGTPLSEIISN